ncbi:MAG TPA: YgjV family protein [Bryobacteraceae bacterium]|nr:YgjV family protein [Bryobacteraceae bacterium]
MALLSPAQIAGYIALVLGIVAFSQKSDRRLLFFNATQSVVYALHFLLLGNFTAAASALVSSSRSYLALRYRAWLLGAAFVCANLALGFLLARNAAGWLPVIGSAIATVAIFRMRGIPFRCVLLLSTLLWLTNDILSRSVGGTLLETLNAATNLATIVRLARARRRDREQGGPQADAAEGEALVSADSRR